MSDPPEFYSLRQTAALFRCGRDAIRARCAKGDFDYMIDGNGFYRITRESILKHLPELEIRNS